MKILAALVFGVCLIALPVLAEAPSPPYAGQQARSIKALSTDDVAALLKGEGIGMAKAAELNGYPGPRHVLNLAAQLRLTPDKRQQVQAIFDRMSAAAKSLGAELVDREQVLDQLFQNGEINPDRLAAETAAIAELHGRLRSVHLAAHPRTPAVVNGQPNLSVQAASWLWRSSRSGGA
jgi:Spy/CpxP family protein refolding chaperone